jgi:hypothetical protein
MAGKAGPIPLWAHSGHRTPRVFCNMRRIYIVLLATTALILGLAALFLLPAARAYGVMTVYRQTPLLYVVAMAGEQGAYLYLPEYEATPVKNGECLRTLFENCVHLAIRDVVLDSPELLVEYARTIRDPCRVYNFPQAVADYRYFKWGARISAQDIARERLSCLKNASATRYLVSILDKHGLEVARLEGRSLEYAEPQND